MKNFVKWLGIIALAAVIGFAFTACDDGSTAHTHTWGAWQSNAAQHWKECDCGEEYGRDNHNGTPCSVCNYTIGSNSTTSLDGVWQRPGGHIVSISGSTGIFVQIDSGAPWQDAKSKSWVSIGGQKFKNLTKTGDRTWTGQEITVQYNNSNPNIATGTTWYDTTFTLSADGQSFTTTTPTSSNGSTWTRQ
jgi:hypothetical protein